MHTVFEPGARVGAAPLPTSQAAAGGAAGHTAAQVHIQVVTVFGATVQNCVRFAYRGPLVDRLHVLELKHNVE